MNARIESSDFRFVDLFAGLGGFHVALSALGGRAVYAAEWEPRLQDLYELNYGLRPVGDIAQVSASDVPDHEVLTAGFPCQPFSKAGEQLGFEHTLQGQLFFKVAEVIEAKRPDFFILENVPNLLRHKGGQTIETILSRLRGLDYEVDYERYSPHHFGVPQIRDRVYIVGALKGLTHFKWPTPPSRKTDIGDVLDVRPPEARRLEGNVARALEIWDDFLQSAPSHVKLPSFPIWSMEFGASYPFEDETPAALLDELGSAGLSEYRGVYGRSLRGLSAEQQLSALPSHARRKDYAFPKWKIDFIRSNRLFYAENRRWIDPWLERSAIEDLPSSFQKFEWNAQGGSRRIWDYVIQTRASGVRVKRRSSAPSLIAMTDTQVPIIGWEARYMTTRECAHLQSLGDIALPDSRTAAYKALGNAVNARVVEHIARPLLGALVADDSTSPIVHTSDGRQKSVPASV